MLDLGADPEPESTQPNPKELDAFRSEAARFQQRRQARGGAKKEGHLFILVIAAILLLGFILAAAWAALESYSSVRPRPASARRLARS